MIVTAYQTTRCHKSTLKMETEYSFETLKTVYQNTRCYNTSTLKMEVRLPSNTLVTIYSSGSQTFSVHRPLGSIYTPTAPPYLFKKNKCAFVSICILYLKSRLN